MAVAIRVSSPRECTLEEAQRPSWRSRAGAGACREKQQSVQEGRNAAFLNVTGADPL